MKKYLPIIIFLVTISSCSILGVHFHIHNPKRAGKYPQPTPTRTLLGDQDSKYRSCYDVKWYSLYINFSLQTNDLIHDRKIDGEMEMCAVALNDLDTIQIDLAPQFQIDFLERVNHPDKFTLTDFSSYSPTSYRKGSAVFIVFHEWVHKGEKFNIMVGYSGIPSEAKRPPWSGGIVHKLDDHKQPWLGVACETEGASLWWPCKDVVNDEPDSADICFAVPRGLVAVGNGVLRDTGSATESDGKRVYWRWHVSYPINTYDITFYIGNYKLLHDTYISPVTHDTLQLNHYVLAQHYDQAKTQFAQLKDYLAFYEQTYGPYPWYRDGFKLVESPYEGMEHQTAIAYGNGFKNNQWGFDYIILHETAHEWWGNAVTAYDLADGWLHEGFATYTEALWVEHKFGHDAYLKYLGFDKLFIINRRPVVGPYGIRYFNYHDNDIYMKGAWVLHSLRYAINNDSVFFGILKSFYADYKYKNATSSDFEKEVERATGTDYKWFFDQYLHNRFSPVLDYCVKSGILYYQWDSRYCDSSFSMPAKVQLFGYVPSWKTISPTAQQIGIQSCTDGSGILGFNTSEFLFKAVRKKKLKKLYRKQLKKTDRRYN